MKALTPLELKALRTPRMCIWCEQDLALVGEGSNYCHGCREVFHGGFRRLDEERGELSTADELEPSAGRWGGGIGRFGDGTPTTDYGRGDE